MRRGEWKRFRGDSAPRRGNTFWAAALVVLCVLVYAGLRWIPQRPPQHVLPRPVQVPAKIVPVELRGWQPLDLNRADVEDLMTLPGIGPVLAERIVMHREEHGPFEAVDCLLDVDGIGPATLERLEDLVQ